MTSEERIKLLEYKVFLLGKQVVILTDALEKFMGTGLNKPMPHGLSDAVQEVAMLGVTSDTNRALFSTAQRGFGRDAPRRVADLPDVVDLE